AAAVAAASVSRRCTSPTRSDTSVRAESRVSAETMVIAAIATTTKAPARRTASGDRNRSAVTGEPEPVAGPEHGLHEPRGPGIVLDLAAEVLDVAVDGAL